MDSLIQVLQSPAYLFHLLLFASNWVISALTYNLVFGKGKIFHFGPIGTTIVTVYSTFVVLKMTDSYLLAILAGVAGAGLISLVFAWLSLRLEPDGLGILTIAAHLSLLAVVLNWTSVTRGSLGITGIPRLPFLQSNESIAIASAILATAYFVFFYFLNKSVFGRRLAALSEHEWYALSLGIDRTVVHIAAFLITGLCNALNVILYVTFVQLLHPNDFQFPAFILYITIAVAGKPGSVVGVTMAAILLTLLKEGIRFADIPIQYSGSAELMIFGLILFAAVWWRRDSLFPVQRSV